MLLGLDGLVQTVAVATAEHEAAGKLIDDEDVNKRQLEGGHGAAGRRVADKKLLGRTGETAAGRRSSPSSREQDVYKRQDYVIKDGQVVIVDEFTGRLMFGRRYSDGLHQAIEAKEHKYVCPKAMTSFLGSPF